MNLFERDKQLRINRQNILPSTLSEQQVPIPVSPLSDTVLCLRPPQILFPGPGGLLCQADSWPGTHPGEPPIVGAESKTTILKGYLLHKLFSYNTLGLSGGSLTKCLIELYPQSARNNLYTYIPLSLPYLIDLNCISTLFTEAISFFPSSASTLLNTSAPSIILLIAITSRQKTPWRKGCVWPVTEI